ncbi:MAG: RNA polymerase sigma factor [Solirubrobacteraceae bacterium]
MAGHAPIDVERRIHFDALFDRHYSAVRAYVARRSSSASVVDDVLSETFLVSWRRIDSVPADGLPWLLGVARRVLANQRRAEARRGALLELLASAPPRRPIVEPAGEVFGELGEAIAALSAREREALLLVAWEGLDPQRAARVVGCPPTAFRARLYRARRQLAARLAPTGRSAIDRGGTMNHEDSLLTLSRRSPPWRSSCSS